jgi:hypothetical protein
MACFLPSLYGHDGALLNRHPEEPRLRGVSKDGRKHRPCGHPSRLALKKGEHLRMTAVLPECGYNASRMGRMPHRRVSLLALWRLSE